MINGILIYADKNFNIFLKDIFIWGNHVIMIN